MTSAKIPIPINGVAQGAPVQSPILLADVRGAQSEDIYMIGAKPKMLNSYQANSTSDFQSESLHTQRSDKHVSESTVVTAVRVDALELRVTGSEKKSEFKEAMDEEKTVSYNYSEDSDDEDDEDDEPEDDSDEDKSGPQFLGGYRPKGNPGTGKPTSGPRGNGPRGGTNGPRR
ncbi:hypothetical protein SCHPADRAFT_940490 [Schizopora paradoxa]|uniref:Uncharacterized protein n=1 Tax=Schizopora paradoxa TaxID=27342 RepID=A0A0H2S938_9AGAM|nr:hypothetical protein SCHPADRAFT_940490 [Schizopora paradoxa]